MSKPYITELIRNKDKRKEQKGLYLKENEYWIPCQYRNNTWCKQFNCYCNPNEQVSLACYEVNKKWHIQQ